jgi:hypothetical protein
MDLNGSAFQPNDSDSSLDHDDDPDALVQLTEDTLISQKALELMVNRVTEMHQTMGTLSGTVAELASRQKFFEGKLVEVSRGVRLGGPPTTRRGVEHVAAEFDLDYEESPTGHHLVYKIPKAHIRAEMSEIRNEEDAKKWQGVQEFFRRNSIKLLDRGFTVLFTALVIYVLHKSGLLR